MFPWQGLFKGVGACVCLLAVATVKASPAFIMTCQFDQQTPFYRELSALYHEVFSTLGMELQLVPETNRRAIANVARGIADANCIRTAELINEGPYANLLQVSVPIARFEFDVFVKQRQGELPSLKEIVAAGGVVGFERGAWIVDEQLHDSVPHPQILAITGTDNAMSMLAADRLQAFVHNRSKVLHALANIEGEVPAIGSTGTFLAARVFMVIHQRHQHLKAPLERQLRATLLQRCQSTDQWPMLCGFFETTRMGQG